MKRFMRVLFAALLLGSLPAGAATTTATMNVTAGIMGSCGVTTVAVNFGTGLPSSITSAIDAQGTVSTTCANGIAYTVAASVGAGAGATFAARRMRLQGNTPTLVYTLYTNPGRTTIWGDGSGGSSVISNTANGTAQPATIYGRILPGQTAPSGAYSDVVTVTVTF